MPDSTDLSPTAVELKKRFVGLSYRDGLRELDRMIYSSPERRFAGLNLGQWSKLLRVSLFVGAMLWVLPALGSSRFPGRGLYYLLASAGGGVFVVARGRLRHSLIRELDLPVNYSALSWPVAAGFAAFLALGVAWAWFMR